MAYGSVLGAHLLTKIQKLGHRLERIRILAPLRALALQDIAYQGSVSDLLVGHVLDEELVGGGDAGGLELGGGELGEAVVEEVELDPFLVQRQVLTKGMLIC